MFDEQSLDPVYEQVRNRLVQQLAELQGPVHVREKELATELGVSRTPVREALLRLAPSGIVNLRRGQGALLTPISNEEYLDWLKVREVIEGLAAREAALDASTREIDAAYALLDPYKKRPLSPQQAESYEETNVNFHLILIKASHSALLQKIWATFGHHQIVRRRHSIVKLNRLDRSLEEHIEILDAIYARDADLAEKRAREHVSSLQTDFCAAIAGDPE